MLRAVSLLILPLRIKLTHEFALNDWAALLTPPSPIISSFVALFIVLTAVLAAISFVLEQTPTVSNMYNSVHCLFFVVLFIFLATKVNFDIII